MTAALDSFLSPTLKHLREDWWDHSFTEFLAETLHPRPGNRILDVGCGEGLAEVSIGRFQISQIRLFGIDRSPHKVVEARERTAAHNQRVNFAAADARQLPFVAGTFDSLFCVAVLQHVADVAGCIAEFARVIRPAGRVVAVEPDHGTRYGYSPLPAGRRAFETATRFFDALLASGGESHDAAIGPAIPGLFAAHAIEPLQVRLFPVSSARLGDPGAAPWGARRQAAERLMQESVSDRVRRLGTEYLAALAAYEAAARAAADRFFEIQNTMLFATVGQRRSS